MIIVHGLLSLCGISKNWWKDGLSQLRLLLLMLYVCNMFPAATAAPFAQNVVRRAILVISPRIQVLLGLAKFSHGLLTVSVTGRGGKGLVSPGGSKVHYDSARDLPRMPVHSLTARHVLMGPSRFLTFWSERWKASLFWSRFDTSFMFCQGCLRMKRGRRAALEHVCAHGIKRKPPKLDSAGGSQRWAPSHPPQSWWRPWGAALLLAGTSSSASSASGSGSVRGPGQQQQQHAPLHLAAVNGVDHQAAPAPLPWWWWWCRTGLLSSQLGLLSSCCRCSNVLSIAQSRMKLPSPFLFK